MDASPNFDITGERQTLGLAPIGARIVAEWIDSVALSPLLVTLSLSVDLTLVAAAANLWFMLYSAIGWSGLSGGQTIGMRLTHIRVLRSDGSKLRLRRAVLRYLVLLFSFMLLGVPLLLVTVTKQRQALHDLVTDTVVVAA